MSTCVYTCQFKLTSACVYTSQFKLTSTCVYTCQFKLMSTCVYTYQFKLMSTCVYTCQFKLMLYTQFVLFAMDADQESAAAAVVIGVLLKRRKSKQRKKRSVWVKPWQQRRNKCIILSYKSCEWKRRRNTSSFLRMSPELFDELLILLR